MVKCGYCKYYKNEHEICSYCNFEYDEDFNLLSDDWNILELDDDLEWSHFQIMYRLKSHNIECIYTDMWGDDVAVIFGCLADKKSICRVLNLHSDSVYVDFEHGLVILNLFQEKFLRGLLE